MTSLRESILSRSPLRGPFLSLPTPMAVEVVCGASPDFVCIDTEHSPIDNLLLNDMLRAADLCQTPALVRTRSHGARDIGSALDAGAVGVVVPHVSDAATARQVVSAARFAPEGQRGCGPARATRHMRDIFNYVGRATKETVVIIQLETVEALDNAAEIMAVPGIDLCFIGPGDLGLDLSARRPDVSAGEAIASFLHHAEKANMPMGIYSPDREESLKWLDSVKFIIEGSDASLLTDASDRAFAKL